MIINDLKEGDYVYCMSLTNELEPILYGVITKIEEFLTGGNDFYRTITIKDNQGEEITSTIKDPVEAIDAFLCEDYVVSSSRSELLSYLSRLTYKIAYEPEEPKDLKLLEDVQSISEGGYQIETHSVKDDEEVKLRTMGASWFVSYAYYNLCDNSHRNWEKAGTIQPRLSSYKNGEKYMRSWINKVLEMNDNKLNKNKIGLTATEIKHMALKVLAKL